MFLSSLMFLNFCNLHLELNMFVLLGQAFQKLVLLLQGKIPRHDLKQISFCVLQRCELTKNINCIFPNSSFTWNNSPIVSHWHWSMVHGPSHHPCGFIQMNNFHLFIHIHSAVRISAKCFAPVLLLDSSSPRITRPANN